MTATAVLHARRQQTEAPQGAGQVDRHAGRVRPAPGDAGYGRPRVQLLDPAVERGGVVRLVEHDLVRGAPEHLQRHAGEGDRARVVDRAAARVRAGDALGDAPDLAASELL